MRSVNAQAIELAVVRAHSRGLISLRKVLAYKLIAVCRLMYSSPAPEENPRRTRCGPWAAMDTVRLLLVRYRPDPRERTARTIAQWHALFAIGAAVGQLSGWPPSW